MIDGSFGKDGFDRNRIWIDFAFRSVKIPTF